jgi:uncharacterized protein YegL
LNTAMRDMIKSFHEPADRNSVIKMMVVRFCNEGADVHTMYQKATNVVWDDLIPSGGTPMGGAFTLVKEQLEDKTVFLSNEYRPMLILASDGQPTDEWKQALEALNNSERAMKADRFALAIGMDADLEVLKEFVKKAKSAEDAQHLILRANEAGEIKKAFKAFTMSVQKRTSSKDDKPEGVLDTGEIECIDA